MQKYHWVEETFKNIDSNLLIMIESVELDIF